MFWLLVVLVKLSVLAKWLARKTSLRKPNLGEGVVSKNPRPKSVIWFSCFIILFHSFIMCLCCPPALRDIFPTSMARYSLFVLKVPLNTNQPNQTYSLFEGSFWTSSFHMHTVSFLSILVMVHDSLKSWSDVTVDQVETFCPPSQPVLYVMYISQSATACYHYTARKLRRSVL